MKTFEIENNDKDVENQPLINRSSSNERNNNANSASANSSSPANVPVDPHAARNRYLKLIFCFAGLQCSYVLWGITQEDLMTTVYSFGKFTSSSFCVFGNRILALIVSFSIVMYRKCASISEVKDVPYYYYAPASLSNTLSSWAQYEALKYISFPVQVLSKSCKVIPVMLVGILVNGKSYPWLEYAEASAITFGVAMFTFSESASNTLNSHHKAKAQGELDASLFSYGILLIGFYLLCDSFTSQWQSRVFKKFGIDQYQMMLGVNVWSTAFTLIALLQAGEFFSTFGLLFQDSNAMWNMIVLSITSATGQLFIFYTIKEFGPVIFTIFMTTRQIISLFLSCIMFGHPLTGFSFFSAFFVFLVVFYRIYRKGSD